MSKRPFAGVLEIFLAISVIALSTPNCLQGQDKYCGIYSLYAAAASLDVDINFEELATVKYVSGLEGSTFDDLIKAANDNSLNAFPLSRLTLDDLIRIEQPVLLNIYSNGQLEFRNHWVAYLGIEGQRLKIADGADGIVRWTTAELLISWRGDGIVITRAEQEKVYAAIFSQHCTTLWKIVILVLVVHLVGTFRPVQVNNYVGSIVLLTGTLIGTYLSAYLSNAGIANPDNRSSLVYTEHLIGFRTLSEVSLEHLQTAPSHTYLLIDSRLHSDFRRGTIEGSINIPVTFRREDFNKSLFGVERSRMLVVFCQNQKCGFGRSVANRLIKMGFENVKLLDRGIDELRVTQ